MKEKFNKILEMLTAKGRAPVGLFALLKMDEIQDRWTVVYADESDTLTEDQKNTIFIELLDTIKEVLSAEDLAQIGRIGVFAVSEHLIQSLLNYQTGETILSQKVNGNFVHEGYIIMSSGKIRENQKAVSADETEKNSEVKGTSA